MPFSQQRFDALCAEYLNRSEEIEDAKAGLNSVKALIMDAVQSDGAVPANAKASRRLEGSAFVATVTTGNTLEVSSANVTELELLCSSARLSDTFKQLFTRRVEYTLVKGADQVMKQTAFPKTIANRVQKLYAACFTAKVKTPSLKVESIKPISERPSERVMRLAKGGR